MLHNWAVKCVLLLGAEPGPGDIEFGETNVDGVRFPRGATIDESRWTKRWSGKLEKFNGGSAPKVEASIEETARAFELTKVRLLKLGVAQAMVDTEGKSAVVRLEQELRRGKWGYRKWEVLQGAKEIMEAEQAVAKENMVAALLKRRKRIGYQCVSTRRRPSSIPKESFFSFSGRPAWRQRPGRPPLPKEEWLRRYRVRLRKRRKGNRAKATLRVKVPRTKRARPRYVLDLNCAKLRPGLLK